MTLSTQQRIGIASALETAIANAIRHAEALGIAEVYRNRLAEVSVQAERIRDDARRAAAEAKEAAAKAERTRRAKVAAAAKRCRALARLFDFEIEEPGASGLESIGVWGPAFLADTDDDPYQGDHYVGDWLEALERAERYAELVKARRAAGLPETSELPEHQPL